MEKARKGPEIVSDFIASLKKDASLNQDIVSIIASLHEQEKLTDKAIANKLEDMRKQRLDETSKNNPEKL